MPKIIIRILVVIYISLGFALTDFLGIEYYCEGPEMLGPYYGNPFIFKKLSSGASMTYYYAIYGLLLNVIFWSITLLIAEKLSDKLLRRLNWKKSVRVVRIGIIIVLMCYSTLSVYIESIMIGPGFEEELNYWHININKEAESWGMECKGKHMLFRLIE